MGADLLLCLNIEVVFDPAAPIEPVAIRIPFFFKLGVKTTVSRTEDIHFIYVHQRQPFLLVGKITGRRKSCKRVVRCQNRPPIIVKFSGERCMIAFIPWTSTHGVVAVPTYDEPSYVQLAVYFSGLSCALPFPFNTHRRGWQSPKSTDKSIYVEPDSRPLNFNKFLCGWSLLESIDRRVRRPRPSPQNVNEGPQSLFTLPPSWVRGAEPQASRSGALHGRQDAHT